MNLKLGIKSDSIEYRYSYRWLFELMNRLEISRLQLGSSFEFFHLPDSYFVDLRAEALSHGIIITSCFTAHRELGGFFINDERVVAVARACYERWIAIGALLGANYVGSNPGAVLRDELESKDACSARFLSHLNELQSIAHSAGVTALCMEPMSCVAEPPSTLDEITHYATATSGFHRDHPDSTVPAYFCGDISHGLADRDASIVTDHWTLFEHEIPWMAEFHFKNTDARYGSTFGFASADRDRGIIDLVELREILARRSSDFPVDELVGYLELPGPKLGRDYSDMLLAGEIEASVRAIREVFPEV